MRLLSILIITGLGVSHVLAQSFDHQKDCEDYWAKKIPGLYNSERSPLDSNDLKFLDFFEYNSSLVIPAKLSYPDSAVLFDVKTSSGKTKEFKLYAIAQFEMGGSQYELEVHQSIRNLRHPIYKEYLFIPFYDLTNGEESYGGGRYMDYKFIEIQNDTLVLNFNKAYNPWCAYSDGYNCPVPPAANRLELRVEAGEKMYKGEYKHRQQK